MDRKIIMMGLGMRAFGERPLHLVTGRLVLLIMRVGAEGPHTPLVCTERIAEYCITISQFYSWNSAIGDGYKNLKTESCVCVGVKGGTASSSTTTKRPRFTGDDTTLNLTETLPGTIDTYKKYY